jgi:NADH-quinone oxidoreductase subunit J
MTPVATTFFFYLLALTAIVSAIAVITRRNPVHAALSLIVTLLSLAGLYLMLYAPFVAGVQIVLYAGGIMVLFLFVIMLVNLEKNIREYQWNKQWMVGTVAALVLGGLLLFVVRRGYDIFPKTFAGLPEGQNTQQIGIALYGNYMLPFEIASLLLLVAIVGAVVMAKKRILHGRDHHTTLPRTGGGTVHDWHYWCADAPQRDHHPDVDRADPECREPEPGGVLEAVRPARPDFRNFCDHRRCS